MLKNKRYVIGNPIGIGGFGITYKCLDLQIGGVCAIKEYLPANISGRRTGECNVFVQDGYLERFNKMMRSFANEANLLKTLRHKNVITSYDSFFENSTAYYVMEYCDGIDLRRYTNNFSRRLDKDEGMNILRQVMDGLEYVHARGILHRDIAPDNIYITSNRTVKILDFGSARSEMDQLYRELSVIIKVGYAPIEQYGGKGKQGHFTDIYALGATFYHLFTGRMPLESTQRVSEDKLVPLSQLRPDLPDNLKFCLERCMVVSKTGRVQNIGEMRRILDHAEPYSSRPPYPPNPPYPPHPISRSDRGDVRYPDRVRPASPHASSGGRAPLSSRVLANLIDSAIFGTVYLCILIPVFVWGGWLAGLLVLMLYPIFSFLINSLFEVLMNRTLGMLMLGLIVMNKKGGFADPGMLFLRNALKMLGVFILLSWDGNDLLEDRITNTAVYIYK